MQCNVKYKRYKKNAKLFLLIPRFLWINRRYLWHLPRSVYFNLKYFRLSVALRLPVFISNKVKLLKTGGQIYLPESIHSGIIKIGFSAAEVFFDAKANKGTWHNEGLVVFKGNAVIGSGSRILVLPNAKLIFGANFWSTAENTINCHTHIEFGKNNLIAFRILFSDSDTHKIFLQSSHTLINEDKPISIGNDVWIGSNAIILKGCEISDGSIVGAGTVTSKKYPIPNVVIAGNPGMVIRENVYWQG